MSGVMSLDAFRQQTLATALAAARKGRATTFGTHPGAETVLTFACSLGWLVSAFHKTRNSSGPMKSGYTRSERGIVNLCPEVTAENAERPTSNIERRIRAELIYKIASTADFWNNQGGQ
jgi:hypothetical protein